MTIINRDRRDGFLLLMQKGHEAQVEEWLLRKYEDLVTKLERSQKEDLKLVSALSPFSVQRF
jgi:hypothetical protein